MNKRQLQLTMLSMFVFITALLVFSSCYNKVKTSEVKQQAFKAPTESSDCSSYYSDHRQFYRTK